MSAVQVLRAGPLATVQDAGRFGMLAYGISASGPMDRGAFAAAGAALGPAGRAGIEFSQSFAFSVDGPVRMALAGGDFRLSVNGAPQGWPAALDLVAGDRVEIAPGAAGNYGYVRFAADLDVPDVLGSAATNVTVGLGGYRGRPLRDGDTIGFAGTGTRVDDAAAVTTTEGPIRILWGLHADLFASEVRAQFLEMAFTISRRHDRMGVRLEEPTNVFAAQRRLTLVSDPIVPGDLQILGDGTPIVLMRDHQPTGGYPRLATIVTADLDRFAQLRPGARVQFRPVRRGSST